MKLLIFVLACLTVFIGFNALTFLIGNAFYGWSGIDLLGFQFGVLLVVFCYQMMVHDALYKTFDKLYRPRREPSEAELQRVNGAK